MYDYIKGIFTNKISNTRGNFLTVETGGIGYLIEITMRDYTQLEEINSECKVYTVLLHLPGVKLNSVVRAPELFSATF